MDAKNGWNVSFRPHDVLAWMCLEFEYKIRHRRHQPRRHHASFTGFIVIIQTAVAKFFPRLHIAWQFFRASTHWQQPVPTSHALTMSTMNLCAKVRSCTWELCTVHECIIAKRYESGWMNASRRDAEMRQHFLVVVWVHFARNSISKSSQSFMHVQNANSVGVFSLFIFQSWDGRSKRNRLWYHLTIFRACFGCMFYSGEHLTCTLDCPPHS